MRSHLLAFELRIARSSRSRAWPLGHCTLQPSRPSSRHTNEGTIESGNLFSINHAIPAASIAPLQYRRPGTLRSANAPVPRAASDSRSGCPKCSARRSACNPPCWRSLSQHITVWRDTPTRNGRPPPPGCPAAGNLAPCRRRRSSSLRFYECPISTPNITIPGTWTARSGNSDTHSGYSQ